MGATSLDHPDFGARHLTLPHHRTLVVRAVRPDDTDGLAALYDGLDLEARYRRFFSAYHPTRAFFEGLASLPDRGGFGLVAELTDGLDSAPVLVAEAGYAPLPNGDGELALTVAHAWRGWLGPYLVDALAAAAAARGVPNLEADVLLTNGPMLAVLKARGCVTMGQPDWTSVRLLVGTGVQPTWPARATDHRRRVLVEGAARHTLEDPAVVCAGVDLLTCAGPTDRHRHCPVCAGEPCALAAEADVVIVSPARLDGAWRDLAAAHPRLHPRAELSVTGRAP